MQQKIWRVMIISITTGIILSIISYVYVFNVVKGTSELTEEMTTVITIIEAVSSLILFIVTGVFCLKDMTKRETLKSAAIVSVYYIIVFTLEQLSQTVGRYSIMTIIDLVFFVPLKIYSSVFPFYYY
jgi:hypothetical protein